MVEGQHGDDGVVAKRYPGAFHLRTPGVEAHFNAAVVKPALELLPDALAYLDRNAGIVGLKGLYNVRKPLYRDARICADREAAAFNAANFARCI